jgi:hypothetical protein
MIVMSVAVPAESYFFFQSLAQVFSPSHGILVGGGAHFTDAAAVGTIDCILFDNNYSPDSAGWPDAVYVTTGASPSNISYNLGNTVSFPQLGGSFYHFPIYDTLAGNLAGGVRYGTYKFQGGGYTPNGGTIQIIIGPQALGDGSYYFTVTPNSYLALWY